MRCGLCNCFALLDIMVGEARMYVQAETLKVRATSHLIGLLTPRSPVISRESIMSSDKKFWFGIILAIVALASIPYLLEYVPHHPEMLEAIIKSITVGVPSYLFYRWAMKSWAKGKAKERETRPTTNEKPLFPFKPLLLVGIFIIVLAILSGRYSAISSTTTPFIYIVDHFTGKATYCVQGQCSDTVGQ